LLVIEWIISDFYSDAVVFFVAVIALYGVSLIAIFYIKNEVFLIGSGSVSGMPIVCFSLIGMLSGAWL